MEPRVVVIVENSRISCFGGDEEETSAELAQKPKEWGVCLGLKNSGLMRKENTEKMLVTDSTKESVKGLPSTVTV